MRFVTYFGKLLQAVHKESFTTYFYVEVKKSVKMIS